MGCDVKTEALGKARDLAGQRFGSLVAVRRVGTSPHGSALWLCRCDCGGGAEAAATRLCGAKKTRCGACSARALSRRRVFRKSDIALVPQRIWGADASNPMDEFDAMED